MLVLKRARTYIGRLPVEEGKSEKITTAQQQEFLHHPVAGEEATVYET
jgi:hypothetical protein